MVLPQSKPWPQNEEVYRSKPPSHKPPPNQTFIFPSHHFPTSFLLINPFAIILPHFQVLVRPPWPPTLSTIPSLISPQITNLHMFTEQLLGLANVEKGEKQILVNWISLYDRLAGCEYANLSYPVISLQFSFRQHRKKRRGPQNNQKCIKKTP